MIAHHEDRLGRSHLDGTFDYAEGYGVISRDGLDLVTVQSESHPVGLNRNGIDRRVEGADALFSESVFIRTAYDSENGGFPFLFWQRKLSSRKARNGRPYIFELYNVSLSESVPRQSAERALKVRRIAAEIRLYVKVSGQSDAAGSVSALICDFELVSGMRLISRLRLNWSAVQGEREQASRDGEHYVARK